jgi:hypothetical protein
MATPEKTARRQNALIVFEDESGVSLLPSACATWAPRGQKPVLRHRFNYRRLSLAGALVYEPDGSNAHLVLQLRPAANNRGSQTCVPTPSTPLPAMPLTVFSASRRRLTLLRVLLPRRFAALTLHSRQLHDSL